MQTYYLVQTGKEDSKWWPKKTNESNHFKVKIWGGFNLTILEVNKSIMIKWKIIIDLNPKSKVTSCRTY